MAKRSSSIRWPTTGFGWLLFAGFVGLLYVLNQRADLQPMPSTELAERMAARCVNVVDGDTLDVTLNGKRERIRLLGIDCMESYNESKQAQQARSLGLSPQQVGRLSKDAGIWLKQQALGQELELIFNPGTPRRGGYDRLLCYVEHGGVDLSLELLKLGLAESRREPHSRKAAYDQAARDAKKAGHGIWGKL